MNAFDDFSCIIITSKQTVNMPVVEVKFDNDDNEVQGDILLGNCPSRSKPTARDHGTSNWTRRN